MHFSRMRPWSLRQNETALSSLLSFAPLCSPERWDRWHFQSGERLFPRHVVNHKSQMARIPPLQPAARALPRTPKRFMAEWRPKFQSQFEFDFWLGVFRAFPFFYSSVCPRSLLPALCFCKGPAQPACGRGRGRGRGGATATGSKTNQLKARRGDVKCIDKWARSHTLTHKQTI